MLGCLHQAQVKYLARSKEAAPKQYLPLQSRTLQILSCATNTVRWPGFEPLDLRSLWLVDTPNSGDAQFLQVIDVIL